MGLLKNQIQDAVLLHHVNDMSGIIEATNTLDWLLRVSLEGKNGMSPDRAGYMLTLS
jgi:hypothetical protein